MALALNLSQQIELKKAFTESSIAAELHVSDACGAQSFKIVSDDEAARKEAIEFLTSKIKSFGFSTKHSSDLRLLWLTF